MIAKNKKSGFWKRLKNSLVYILGGDIKADNQIYPSTEMDEKYLFDFKPMFGSSVVGNFNGTGLFINNITAAAPTVPSEESTNIIERKPIKMSLTPKQALKELETVPTNISLANLDDKIAILKDKEKLIRQTYANREVKALLERLENRKKYLINKEFFDQFQNTTQEKIDELLEKTGLVMKESDIFIPEFPDDAIAIMKAYTEKVEKISGKKPVYYVIADSKDFKSAYEKRDPILLAQSPFGFYYQILGAWDEEMLLLHEL